MPSSGTGTVKRPSSGTGTVPKWVPTYMPRKELAHLSYSLALFLKSLITTTILLALKLLANNSPKTLITLNPGPHLLPRHAPLISSLMMLYHLPPPPHVAPYSIPPLSEEGLIQSASTLLSQKLISSIHDNVSTIPEVPPCHTPALAENRTSFDALKLHRIFGCR